MYYLQLAVLCVTVANVIGDLPPGTRRNTYLPPEPTKGGYTYSKPPVQFPKPTPSFPGPRPTPTFPGPRPTPSVPRPTPTYLEPRPTPTYGVPRPTSTYGVPRPTPTYSVPRPTPTPGYPTYNGQGTGINGNTIEPAHDHHHHHEPGMPFDFNYAVKEDAFGNDYSHNAISDGDIVRGEYRVQLPDGRTQVVRYTADWQHGFSAQVSYDGNPRYDIPRPGGDFRGY
ncbi:pro-resilin [Polyergus mexicanus]|uniref:pro-resilin n=1 Tax=Polyergus mexicanus TaxID=615972 RepID=UPI0038B64C33